MPSCQAPWYLGNLAPSPLASWLYQEPSPWHPWHPEIPEMRHVHHLQCGTATSAACNLVSTSRSRNIAKTSCLLLGALARFPAGKTHSIVISLEYIRELTFRKTVPDPYSFQ